MNSIMLAHIHTHPVNAAQKPPSKQGGSDEKFEDVFKAPKKDNAKDTRSHQTSDESKVRTDNADEGNDVETKPDASVENSNAKQQPNEFDAKPQKTALNETTPIEFEAVTDDELVNFSEDNLANLLSEIESLDIPASSETNIETEFSQEGDSDFVENTEIDIETLSDVLANTGTEQAIVAKPIIDQTTDIPEILVENASNIQAAQLAMSTAKVNVDVSKADSGMSAEAKFQTALNDAQQPLSATGGQANGNHSNDSGGQKNNQSAEIIKLADKVGMSIEGVEVLETKSFVAPAMPAAATPNANSIIDKIMNSRELSAALASKDADPIYSTSQPKVLNTMKIQLAPANLGMVTVEMKLQGEELQVRLRVDNMDAYRQLTDDSSIITKALRGQGFGIEQINVQLSMNDRGSSQQGQQQAGQQQANAQSNSEQFSNPQQKQNQSQSSNYSGLEDNDIGKVDADQTKNDHAADGVYI